jgi:hypothetical protein
MATSFEVAVDPQRDRLARPTWVQWPVYWSAVWVGALSAFAVALLIGLIGVAVRAHEIWVVNRVGERSSAEVFWTLVFCVLGSFISFVVGGWVAGKIAGLLHSETAMLHGAIVWLVTVPMLLLAGGIGAGSYFGGWYGGLAGRSSWGAAPVTVSGPSAAAPNQANPAPPADAARVARNSAAGAATALLIGLIASVIGGWLASGEPMNFTHYRTRNLTTTGTTQPRL